MADILTRAAKQYFEQVYFQQTERQLFNRLFNVVDESTDSNFILDKYTGNPYALTYRQKDGQSRVAQYAPGSGILIDVPIASRKTPITEELLDRVAAGIEAIGGFGINEAQMVNQIVRDHVAGLNMTKNKQALDVFADGKFYAKGPAGADIGLDISFWRNASNDMTYDFTTGGASMSKALQEAQDYLRTKSTPLSNMVCIMGASWLSKYGSDTSIQAYTATSTQGNVLIQQLMPPELIGIDGLHVVGQYRAPGMVAPMWICAYAPPVAYIKDEGEAAGKYVADTQALFFALDDVRYKVNRGVNVLDENGKRVRAVGDLVIDRFSDNDPVVEYLRTSTRHCFVPGNPDHTAKSTGTF